MVSEIPSIAIQGEGYSSLNPCFSGGWSRRVGAGAHKTQRVTVLILVLVEDGLGVNLILPPPLLIILQS